MNAITRQELQALAQTRETPCVSFYVPVGVGRDSKTAASIRLKNQLRDAEAGLVATGMRDADARAMLSPVADLVEGQLGTVPPCQGLAVFLTLGKCRIEPLPVEVAEAQWVGHRFYIRPLLPLLKRHIEFWLLAVSQNKVRLYRGDALGLTEERVANMPAGVADVIDAGSHDGTMQVHTARQGGSAKQDGAFHGQGGISDHHKANIMNYFHEVDRALHAHLHGDERPLIFAGVDYLYPLFARVTHHPHLAAEHISGSTDHLESAQLHRDALAVLRPTLEQEQRIAVKEFENSQGSYLVSDEVHHILPAASEGRVKSLLLCNAGALWGRFDAASGTVRLEEELVPGSEDLLDRACVEVIRHGGDVFVLGSREITRGAPMAAVLRYASAPVERLV